MRAKLWVGLVVGFVSAQVAAAATIEVSGNGYWLNVIQPEVLTMPNGEKVGVGGRSHGSLVGSDGETTSIWCHYTSHLNAAEVATTTIGHCEQVYDNGDTAWLSFVQQFPSREASWTVFGGTGRFAGATGSGTTKDISDRGDGVAWTSVTKGTIKTK